MATEVGSIKLPTSQREAWTSDTWIQDGPACCHALDAVAGLLPRQRQETAANLCWACRGRGKGLAGAPGSCHWTSRGVVQTAHSGPGHSALRTRQHASPDELQPTSLTLEINSHLFQGNKKMHISACFHHVAGNHMKHVCFKHIAKELLDAHNLR